MLVAICRLQPRPPPVCHVRIALCRILCCIRMTVHPIVHNSFCIYTDTCRALLCSAAQLRSAIGIVVHNGVMPTL